MRRISTISAIFVLSLAGGACEQVKSYNPLSPNLAGPIPWVEITAPKLLEPQQGQKFMPDQQPLTLLIENSSSNGPRPLYYTIEIAADSGFSNILVKRERVSPGENGRTSLRLEGNLQNGRSYFWRARAEDGANTGPHSGIRNFEMQEPVVIQAPAPLSPVGGLTITTLQPALTVANAARQGPHGVLFYQFEVALDQAFAARIYDGDTLEGGGQTVAIPGVTLPVSSLLYWRARVTDGKYFSPWSSVSSFRTPAAPTPGPGPGPGPQPPGGGPVSCGPPYPTTGDGVVACVAAAYPDKLVAGVSLHEREANMAFLRDRVIEVGRCGGLDLAWNLKRGVGPHSIDAIAWRVGGVVEVVDIGVAFDDTSRTLELAWQIVGGPPGYDPYPPTSCK